MGTSAKCDEHQSILTCNKCQKKKKKDLRQIEFRCSVVKVIGVKCCFIKATFSVLNQKQKKITVPHILTTKIIYHGKHNIQVIKNRAFFIRINEKRHWCLANAAFALIPRKLRLIVGALSSIDKATPTLGINDEDQHKKQLTLNYCRP